MFILIARVLTGSARVPFRMPWTTRGEMFVVTGGPLMCRRRWLNFERSYFLVLRGVAGLGLKRVFS